MYTRLYNPPRGIKEKGYSLFFTPSRLRYRVETVNGRPIPTRPGCIEILSQKNRQLTPILTVLPYYIGDAFTIVSRTRYYRVFKTEEVPRDCE